MNFVDIIKEFNGKVIHKSDIYYITDNNNGICYFRQSYIYQDLLILRIEYNQYYFNNIIHINNLKESILNFLSSNFYYFCKYKKYAFIPSKYLTPANDKYIHIPFSSKNCNIFNTDLIILEFNNGFYKLPNTDLYVYTTFEHTFYIDDFNIIPLFKHLEVYLKSDGTWTYILSDKNYQTINNLYDEKLFSLYIVISFNKEEFNNVTSRLKNENILDILNINQFRRKQ